MPACIPFYDCTNDCTNDRSVYPPIHTYRHRGRWPPPEPRPVLHCPAYPYVHYYKPPPAEAQRVLPGERRDKEGRSTSRDSKRRQVRFVNQPIIIDLPSYPPLDRPSAHAPAPAPPRAPTPARVAAAIRPSHASTPATHPIPAARHTPAIPSQSYRHHSATDTSNLHDLLESFPSGLWNMRRNARPTYHARYEPRYSEPVFPNDCQMRSIKLFFTPCGRTEFSWIAKVKADSGKRLTVNNVLEAISTELFKRSACRDLYEGHPCYGKVRSAHRIRTRRGYTDRPCYDDAFRNVDLYHVDRGQVLYFKGLRRERLRDGEVVYLVKFSYA